MKKNAFLKPLRGAGWVFAICSLPLGLAWGQTAEFGGVNIQGVTGGLVIPSARVLPSGAVAASYGDYQEPQTGSNITHQNMSLGLGILPGVEVFGRFAHYTDTPKGAYFDSGISDLSANMKVEVPWLPQAWPKVAVGANDVAGGAVNFKSAYVVATQQWGSLTGTVGYAVGRSTSGKPTFDGAFGGLNYQLGSSGLSVLAEHDGQQAHAGVRWASLPMESMGGMQLLGTVQRSFNAQTPQGVDVDATRFALTLMLPLGDVAKRRSNYQPVAKAMLPEPPPRLSTTTTATPLSVPTPAGAAAPATVTATTPDRLPELRAALVAVGLERVRVGLRDGLLGEELVVEYENHRYGHNEVDAIGLVLGLAAEMAPLSVQRVQAVTLKDGLRLYETGVGVAVYRSFLRGGPGAHVRDSLTWDLQRADRFTHARWQGGNASGASRLRVEIKPDLNYTLGTEVGAFDYALAANVQLTAPLWSGARLTAGYTVPVDHSANTEGGYAFAINRQRQGLRTVALGQSFWLGEQILLSASAGRYHFDTMGLQAEAVAFVPGTSDVVRLRGAGYDKAPGGLAGNDHAGAISYRHQWSTETWLEAGLHRFSDGSSGPSFEWTRWFSDFGMQVFYRMGGDAQFAGLQLSFPLTPRQGMKPGLVNVFGTSQYAQSIRTRITTPNQPANLVQPSSVRDLKLETSLDSDVLNAGRVSQRYLEGQVDRMREAFYRYGRGQLPEVMPPLR